MTRNWMLPLSAALMTTGALAPGWANAAGLDDLGPNTYVFDPSMDVAEIEATANAIWAEQVNDEMGSGRYALVFEPGEYGTAEEPLNIRVGYYTEVLGLGALPGDTQITGTIEVYNRCFDDPGNPEFSGCFALNNFWRGMANLKIQVVNDVVTDELRAIDPFADCHTSANFWAVSQAVSLRRVEVTGGTLSLMDYCSGPAFASGGFIADSRADVILNGSQQQWYTRDSEVGEWTNAVWNQVFTGTVGAPADDAYPAPPYTTFETTPLSREKPYLYPDASGELMVRVAAAATDTRGVSWSDGLPEGRSIPLDDFQIVTPGVSHGRITQALARGKHLLFTPGMYDIAQTIRIRRPDTVVLGIGIATLTAQGGATPIAIDDVPGVVVAGLTIDAGPRMSRALMTVGAEQRPASRGSDPANPITLSDVYFRVGGPYVGKTEAGLVINAANVLVDHTWIWRADHGVEGFDPTDGAFGDSERWRTNIGEYGLIVNGDDVTATGLFVEHFQKFNTTWNGERGRVYLYQNELPYDPPTQAEWTAPDGSLGYPGYKVTEGVEEHFLAGGGVYVFNRNNPDILTDNGYEVPEGPGITLYHVMINNLSGPGTILAVVNGVGETVDGIWPEGDPDSYEDPAYIVEYP